jgi:hypothetical protein
VKGNDERPIDQETHIEREPGAGIAAQHGGKGKDGERLRGERVTFINVLYLFLYQMDDDG